MHNIDDQASSAWGKHAESGDVRALRRYNALLLRMVSAGEASVYVLTVLTSVLFVWFLYTGNFENIIFTDGTDRSCILQGATGEIVNGN